MSRRRRTRLHVFVCWLWAQRAPKVTISGAVKTFSSTPRQSRRYQITDRRRGFLLFTLTHWRFVKAQRRSLRRPRYVCVYYFYEIDLSECTLAPPWTRIMCPHEHCFSSAARQAAKFTESGWPQSNLYSRAAKNQQRPPLLRSLAFFFLSAGWFRGAAPSLAGAPAHLCYRVFWLLDISTDTIAIPHFQLLAK